MIKRLHYRFLILAFLLLDFLTYAQSVPPPPDGSESGDIGVGGKSPIDEYIYILLFVGILFIIVNYYRMLKKSTI